MKQWQRAVSTLGDRSTWQFHRADSLRYDNLAMDSIFDMLLYTNRGIGLVDIPVRFNCPPEVTEITLCAA